MVFSDKESPRRMEAILKASIALRRRADQCLFASTLLDCFFSSHKNKIRETELEEKFTDTLNVIEVVSVVETYQSDENNLTYKR